MEDFCALVESMEASCRLVAIFKKVAAATARHHVLLCAAAAPIELRAQFFGGRPCF